MIRLRNEVKQTYSGVEVYLQKRYDLIPNLVKLTQEYMKYERETLESITKLRNEAIQGGMAEKIKNEPELAENIEFILARSENYPELKAIEQFNTLSKNMISIENNIAASRRNYNANVQQFNSTLESFPFNLFAGILGFKKFPFFEKSVE